MENEASSELSVEVSLSEIVDDIAAEQIVLSDNEQPLSPGEILSSSIRGSAEGDNAPQKLDTQEQLDEQSSKLCAIHGVVLHEGLYSWKEILAKLRQYGCVICPNECGQEFSSLLELTQHLKRCGEHSAKFKCDTCNEHFVSRVMLYDHNTRRHSDSESPDEEGNKSPKSRKFFQIEGISVEKPKIEDVEEQGIVIIDKPRRDAIQPSKKANKIDDQLIGEGRKRKSIISPGSSVEKKKLHTEPENDGTPPSLTKSPESVAPLVDTHSSTKRKSGRPRKCVVLEKNPSPLGPSTDMENNEKSGESLETPRRRGRPRKPVVIKDDDLLKDEDYQLEEGDEQDGGSVETLTPKKRGRPKSNTPKNPSERRGRKPKSAMSALELKAVPDEFLNEDGSLKTPAETIQDFSLLKEIFKKKKKVGCPSLNCDKIFQTILGYKGHALVCGLSSVERKMFKCDECEKAYASELTLKNHKRIKHTKQPEEESEPEKDNDDQENVEVTPSTGRARRKAASRCMAKVQKLASDSQTKATEHDESSSESEVEINSEDEEESEEDVDDDDVDDDEIKEEEEEEEEEEEAEEEENNDKKAKRSKRLVGRYDKYMTILQSAKYDESARERVAMWRKELEMNNVIVCKNEGCVTQIKSIPGMKYHMGRCGKDSSSNLDFKCNLCDRAFRSKGGCEYHIENSHLNPKEVIIKGENEGTSQSFYSKRMTQSRKYGAAKSLQMEYQKETEKWLEVLHCNEWIFPDWIPKLNHWRKVAPCDESAYLPKSQISPRFRIENPKTGKNVPDMQLPQFGKLKAEDSSYGNWTIFVGGPIWAMNWCPLPESVNQHDQYLAVCCHQTFDEEHSLTNQKTLSKNGLQIWNMGPLHKDSEKQEPQLSMIIAHEYGALWDIAWCPSGAWQAKGSTDKTDDLSRLGLLALACEDGIIRLLSIPHPDELIAKSNPDNEPASKQVVFHATPVAELIPSTIGHEKSPHTSGTAWSLAWVPASPHRKLAAGYSDGTVAIWDLMSASPLQKIPHPQNLDIPCYLPFSHFLAHSTTIRGLAWCPSKTDIIATGSYDRFLKVWDLNSPLFPVNSLKKSVSLELAWPINWTGIMTVEEDCFVISSGVGGRFHDMVYGVDPTKGSIGHLCTAHCSTVWSCSLNNRANLFASSSNGGEVVGFIMQRFYISFCGMKQLPSRRWSVYRTYLEDINTRGPNPAVDDEQPSSQNQTQTADQSESSGKSESVVQSETSVEKLESSVKSEDGTTKENQSQTAGNMIKTYDENDSTLSGMISKYRVVFKDTCHYQYKMNLTDPEVARLKRSETMSSTTPMQANLQAIHKVCWNPNRDSCSWLTTGGAAGFLRIHCMSNIE